MSPYDVILRPMKGNEQTRRLHYNFIKYKYNRRSRVEQEQKDAGGKEIGTTYSRIRRMQGVRGLEPLGAGAEGFKR